MSPLFFPAPPLSATDFTNEVRIVMESPIASAPAGPSLPPSLRLCTSTISQDLTISGDVGATEGRLGYTPLDSQWNTHPRAWHERALMQLSSLRDLADGWDENAAPAPDATAFQGASFALDVLHELGYRPTSILPSADGGIVISLGRRGRIASLAFFNDGEICASTATRYTRASAWEIEDSSGAIEDALSALRAFIEQ